MKDCQRTDVAKRLQCARVCAPVAKAANHCAAAVKFFFSPRRFRKIRQPAARMFFSASSLLPAGLESDRDLLCVGPPRAGGGSVFLMNKSSCLSLIFVQWLKLRSAPKKFGTPSAARESSRVQSNFLQALREANGNSASCRKWTCLTAHPGALNQRNSDATIVCSIGSRNLNRRRNRTLGRSKKIPDISA